MSGAKDKGSYHHGNLRETLIEVAMKLLAERGVAALSLREVAKAAGVSHGAPYRHFKDKQALLEAIAAEGFRHIRDACRQAVAHYPGDPRRQLEDAGTEYLLYVSRHREVSHLMFSGFLALDASGEGLRQVADESFQALVEIIENGKTAGLYGDRDTMDLTLASLSAVHGLSLLIGGGLLKHGPLSDMETRALGSRVSAVLMEGMLARA